MYSETFEVLLSVASYLQIAPREGKVLLRHPSRTEAAQLKIVCPTVLRDMAGEWTGRTCIDTECAWRASARL